MPTGLLVRRDPFHVEEARALLGEGQRAAALEALEEGCREAAKHLPRRSAFTGDPELDLWLVESQLEGLEEIRSLAREAAGELGWGSFESYAARFDEVAAGAAHEADGMRETVEAESRARRHRDDRRRLRKALGLCAVLPLFVALGLGLNDYGPGAEPSTFELVLGLLVVPVVFASLAAIATLQLWRRGVTTVLLYAPFWLCFVVAAGISAAVVL